MFIRNQCALRRNQRGVSLPELVVFIVVVGIALVSVVTALSLNTRHSADPLVEKQAVAIAEALLEEVESMPFTQCTLSQQYNVVTKKCDPAPPKSRGSTTAPFDNVLDYNGFALSSGDPDIGNSGYVTVPAGYVASVSVLPDSLFGPASSLAPSDKVVRIAVTVTYAGGSVVLEGYRTKYVPDDVTP